MKVIGISADALHEHYEWIDDIIEIGNKTAPTCVEYPIVCPRRTVAARCTLIRTQIADPLREVSNVYEMTDNGTSSNVSDEEYHIVRAAESYKSPPLLNPFLDSHCLHHRPEKNHPRHAALPRICRPRLR